jgi:hypothetical protein
MDETRGRKEQRNPGIFKMSVWFGCELRAPPKFVSGSICTSKMVTSACPMRGAPPGPRPRCMIALSRGEAAWDDVVCHHQRGAGRGSRP